MPGKSSEITEALLRGCYLLSACPLAVFRSLSVGLNLLGAIQTQALYSQRQRNLFMGQILVKLWSSLDLCVRGSINCYVFIRLNSRKDSGSPGLRLGGDAQALSQGGFHLPWTVHPRFYQRPGAELLLGIWCWEKPLGLRACQGREVESVAISSGWVIIGNEDFSGQRRRPWKQIAEF